MVLVQKGSASIDQKFKARIVGGGGGVCPLRLRFTNSELYH